MKGMVSGLKLSDTLDDLAVLYLAAVQSVAYGTRHIIEEMNSHGFAIETIAACGGGTKNEVFLREHADITGCSVILPQEPEAVLLGSAILGASASGVYPNILQAMAAMSRVGRSIAPAKGRAAEYHRAKYQVFHRMYEDQMNYRKLMGEEDSSCR